MSVSLAKDDGPTHWKYEVCDRDMYTSKDSAKFERMIYERYEREMENWHQQASINMYNQMLEQEQRRFWQETAEIAMKQEAKKKKRVLLVA